MECTARLGQVGAPGDPARDTGGTRQSHGAQGQGSLSGSELGVDQRGVSPKKAALVT